MYVNKRCIAGLGAFALIASLSACGSDSSGVIVAQVEGVGTISKAALDHWIPVEAVVLYKEYPIKPVPKGLIPDPPDYTDCIAFLRKTPRKFQNLTVPNYPVPGQKLTNAQLKGLCAVRYQELKTLTLNTLIGWDWTIAAGKTLGMTASDTEVKQRFIKINKQYWPKEREYKDYLRFTDQTDADMMLRYRVQVFEQKILEKLEALAKSLTKGANAQLRSEVASLNEYMAGKHWVSITSCHAGYVVSGCRQYRGPLYPGLPN